MSERPTTTRPEAPARPTGPDRLRQLGVTLSYVLCLVGSALGVGAFGGTPIADAAGGALSADATHLAPGTGAFSVWSLIYAGLAAYTIFQWLPGQAAAPRQRRIGWWVAASMLLNAGWILVVQAGRLWPSVLVIAVLLVVLATIFTQLVRVRGAGALEAVVVDGTLGLYLGWVSVATCANVAAALVAAGFDGLGLAPEVWSAVVLAVVAAIGVGLAVFGRGRLAPAATIVWGLSWIAVARATGEPHSVPTAVAAVLAAVVVTVATVWLRLTRGRNTHRG
ncbi:TspO/MBR related protein [Georgenia soli]|uniref:TspO/MBR related protein n=1 Tax=Georgenia soli TaxID=638953 RepID=A0A2A9ELJ0_9MICO|nr:tryptophan-rich sensory protein [Georgenia soli]PFG39132.1 TspO/MBR related protein [Georgenia soli]